MRRYIREGPNIRLLDEAKKRVEEYRENFHNRLMLQTNMVAQKEKVNAVSDVHVDEAYRIIMQPRLRPKV